MSTKIRFPSSFLEQLAKKYLIEDIATVKAHYPEIEDDTFFELLNLDPTFKKGEDRVGTYGKWLLNLYKRTKKIPDEKVTSLLKDFDSKKRNLPIENRNIDKFKTVDDLENLLNSTEIELTKSQKNKLVRKEIRNTNIVKDATYIGRFGNFDIYSPNTYQASCKLGQGTTWCTASNSNDNWYNNYTARGPLYILINYKDPTEKYQIHFETNSFMNKDDKTVSKYKIQKLLIENPELWTEWMSKLQTYSEIEKIFEMTYEQVQNPDIRDKIINKSNRVSTLVDMLAQAIDVSPFDIEEGDDNTYEVDGGGTYLVLDDDEADRHFRDSLRNLLDDVGFSGLGIPADISDFIDTDRCLSMVYDDLREMYYQESIEYVAQEAFDRGLLSAEDFDEYDEDNEEPVFDSVNVDEEEIINELAEDRISEYENDPISYFIDMLGNGRELNKFVEDYGLFDFDGFADWIKRNYGRGADLAYYDNNEIELGELGGTEYFAYRIE